MKFKFEMTVDQTNGLLNILNNPNVATTSQLFYFINLIQEQAGPQAEAQQKEKEDEQRPTAEDAK